MIVIIILIQTQKYVFFFIINKLLSEENMIPATLFEATKGGGVRHM